MVPVKSSYHSPLRARQAEESRRAVLRAAHELFVERGYGATTIEAVAERAGVSKPTVFNAVGNKVTLFKVVRDVAMAGDDQDVAVSDRASVAAIGSAPDVEHAVLAVADHVTAVVRRYHRLHQVLRGAAGVDPSMAELADDAEQQRLVGAGHLLERLRQHGEPSVDPDRARDVLWLLMAPDHYTRLVQQRGWTDQAYRDWLAGSIRDQLFAEAGRRSASRHR